VSARPGPRDLITDVDGLLVGNAEDRRAVTGTTVILCSEPATGGVDVRGGAPGTRETNLLDPVNSVDHVDAIVLSGGSAYGLDAASGVMHWLAERGRGLAIRGTTVPLVPAAILFDLVNGGDKSWTGEPPYRLLGRAAAAAAGADFAIGAAGAGFGARAGSLRGGLGSASAITADGLQVGAIVAVNSFGTTVDHRSGDPFAPAFGGEYRSAGGLPLDDLDLPPDTKLGPVPGGNTTIGLVATNVTLTKAEATRLAIMAQDGLAVAIRPAHTPFDGDTVFALSTRRRPMPQPAAGTLMRLGHLAATCMARAIARGILSARDLRQDHPPSTGGQT
jgi:L-aminopeptidase/D-esterase-like protein